ncbi:hypothetical protein BgAZ_110090 [Babesia gibsoni]|uniref:MIP18 family-like domain-containing protein n=1 Tax=Babesia gibsoni TaxID=33632 RepID=A0AAD8PGK7_BABGI|nr:hypothetical protein BgAZ_110090 [Babesia gibsoni]
MDNANPVLYKPNRLSTAQSDRRLLDDKRGGDLFLINSIAGGNVMDEEDDRDEASRSLFQPTTSFQPFDASEIFDIIRNIKDPEYSYTLEALKIVEEENIHIDNENSIVTVYFTPTVPHCSQLYQSLPPYFKIDVQIAEGTHNSEHVINKQLLDKERVAAALENPVLVEMINDGIYYNEGLGNRLVSI